MSAPLPAASAAGPGTPPGLAGQNWTAVPTHAKVVAAGQRIGDHSVSHPYFTKLTDAQMRDEVLGAESQITSVTGVDPWPWFRFPYGDYDAHAISVVNGTGFVPVGWTVDTLGWKGPQAASPSRRWSTG